MSNLTTRAGKGSPLTNNELDANFTNLNADKVEIGGDLSGTSSAPNVAKIQGRAVSADVPAIGEKLVWNGTAWEPSADPTNEPIGHEDKSSSSISFNSGTRTFTISPVAANFVVWCKGVKYTYTSAQTVVIPDTTGLHFIYFNASGVLSTQMSYFTWEEHAPTAYVYWNATTQQAVYFGDERHGITLDWQTHEYLHRTRGAAIASGFGASGYTTTGAGATDADAQIDIGGGTFFDEDLQVDIVSTNTPVSGSWQQDLSGPARIPVLYLSGSAWVVDAPTNFPFKVVSGVPQYNLYSGGSWSTAPVANNEYFVSWILATHNLTYPVIAVISQAPTNQLSAAEAMTFEGLNLNGFPSVEFRPLYKVIYQYKSGFTNSVKASTIAVYDIRSIAAAGVAAALVQDHGNLSGLGDDDHAQYLHVSEVRSPSTAVKNSFLPSQTSQSGKYLTTDGSNPSWGSIPSGSLTFTGDVTGSGTTGSSTTLTLSNSGASAGTYTKVTVDAKGRVTTGASINSSDITTALGFTPENSGNKGVANGYASLDGSGKVPSVQLPSYVDDVLEYANLAAFPGTGETGKIYIAIDTAKTYRWSGSAYVEISASPGSTDAVPEGSTNLYFTNSRARGAITATGSLSYNNQTGVLSYTQPTNVSTFTNDSGYLTGITGTQVTTALGYTPLSPSANATVSGFYNFTNASGININSDGYLKPGATGYASSINLQAQRYHWAIISAIENTSNAERLILRGAGVDTSLYAGGVEKFTLAENNSHTLTGSLSVTGTITGTLSGNASTATALQTARTINGVSFDGTANITIGRLFDEGGSGSNIRLSSGNELEYYSAAGTIGTMYLNYSSADANSVRGPGGSTFINSSNYNSYAPSLTGAGASGTWGISITGNAATVSSITSGQVTTALGYTPLNRATVTGDWNVKTNGQASLISGGTNNHNGTTTTSGIYLPHSSGGYGVQIGGRLDTLWFRTEENNVWASWRVLLHSGNYTSYSPSLTGSGASGTWGINITGNAATATSATDSTKLPLAGGTLTGKLKISLGGGTTPSNYFEISNTSSTAGQRAGLQLNTGASWSTTFYTESGNWWHAFGSDVGDFRWGYDGTNLKVGSNTVLHAGNYTSYSPSLTGSGASGTWGISITGNAATAYGLDVHTGRNSDANKVVRTDANGYIQAGWINTTSGSAGTTAPDRIYGSYDGYIRYYTPANLKSVLSLLDTSGGTLTGNLSGTTIKATSGFYHGSTGYWKSRDNSGGSQFAVEYSTSATLSDSNIVFSLDTSGNAFRGSFSTAYLHAANYSSYALPLSGGTLTGSLFGTLGSFSGAVEWGNGSSVMNAGNPRSLRIGYSGGNYGAAGYGITFTTSSGVHNYAINDIVSYWEAYDGITVRAAPGGAVGTAVSWTNVLDARRSNTSMTFKGNVVLSANNYTSYSPSLTGSGASGTWGISISGSAAQLGGNSSSAYSGPASTIKQFFWNDLSANGTQARTFEIARLSIDYNDWNTGTGPFEVELYEDYYSRGLKKKYVIYWGYTNSYGIQLVEYSGNGDNNFQVRIGTPVQVSGDQYYLQVYVDVRYYSRVDVRVTTNRDITASNPPPIGQTYINSSPSAVNISDFTADSTVNFASTTAVQINGNQLLHAGNYNSYALPLSGGTLTGELTQNGNNTWYAGSNNHRSNSEFNFLTYSGGAQSGKFRGIQVSDSYSGSVPTGGILFGTDTTLVRAATTYGSIYINGARNGYHGTMYATANGNAGWMTNGNASGYYNHSYGWKYYHESGVFKILSGTYGGGTEYTALHSGNYNSYAPSLTGSGASGTWGISITGNAATASNSTNLGGNSSTYYDHRAYNVANNYLGAYYVGSGTEKPNDAIFGAGKLKLAMLNSGNLGFGGSWNDVLWMSSYTGGDVKPSYAIVGDKYSDELYFSRQNYDSASWGTGRRLLHSGNYTSFSPSLTGSGASGSWAISVTGSSASCTGNAATATTLQTARTINGVSFNGSANITVADSTKLPLAGGTMTGALNFASIDQGAVLQHNGNAAAWYGRILTKNSTNDRAAFLGTYLGIAGVFAHNNALNAWADLYVNTVDGSGGGTVRMPSSVLVNGSQVLHAANYSSYALPLSGGTLTGQLNLHAGSYEGSITFGSSSVWRCGIRQHDDADAELRIWHANAAGMIFLATGYNGEPSAISRPTDGLAIQNNRLGIGNFSSSDPAYKLHVIGDIYATSNVTAYSDERVKTNWRGVGNDFIARLSGVKSGVYDRTDIEATQVGVSAQSLREVIPEAVMESAAGDLSVVYGNAAMVSAVELAKEIVNLKREIEMLKLKIH